MSRRRKTIIGLVVLTALAVSGAYWWNEHRSEPLTLALNPVYWLRRWQGEDLYDPKWRILYHGSRDRPEIALTFDDGPHTPTGEQILDILKAHDVCATFFIVGSRAKERPDLIRRMTAEGHEIGNHSQTHLRLDELRDDQVRREIRYCDINVRLAGGPRLRLLRPPGVRYNDTVLRAARDLGYITVSWSCAAKDFDDVSPDFIVSRILRRVENGSIILLHDERAATVTALPRLLERLKRSGYRFVTISEMLQHLPDPVSLETVQNQTAGNGSSRQGGIYRPKPMPSRPRVTRTEP